MNCRYIDTSFKNKNYSIRHYSTKAENIPLEFRDGKKPYQRLMFSANGQSEDLPTTKKYEVNLTGKMYVSHKYGLCIKVENSELVKPKSQDGIVDFLCEFVDGIGRITAKKLVIKYGKETLEILENEPEKLLELKGIRKKTNCN